jgi:hypothetical protein
MVEYCADCMTPGTLGIGPPDEQSNMEMMNTPGYLAQNRPVLALSTYELEGSSEMHEMTWARLTAWPADIKG